MCRNVAPTNVAHGHFDNTHQPDTDNGSGVGLKPMASSGLTTATGMPLLHFDTACHCNKVDITTIIKL